MGGIKLARVGKRHGYHGALRLAELLGAAMEMTLCHCFGTIYAIAHLDGVEIHLHNPLLAPHHFDEGGEIYLEALSHPCATGPQKDVLGCLLGYGAGSELALVLIAHVALGSFLDGIEVEAMMLHEPRVLACHHRKGLGGRNLVEGHPTVSHLHLLALDNLFAQANEHQGSEIHGDEPEGNNRKDGGAKEGYHHPFHDFLNSIKNDQFFNPLIF